MILRMLNSDRSGLMLYHLHVAISKRVATGYSWAALSIADTNRSQTGLQTEGPPAKARVCGADEPDFIIPHSRVIHISLLTCLRIERILRYISKGYATTCIGQCGARITGKMVSRSRRAVRRRCRSGLSTTVNGGGKR